MPPLRERKGDVELLVRHFVSRYARKMGKSIAEIPARIMEALVAYPWPGNVRELENVIERAVIITRKSNLELGECLPQPVVETEGGTRLKTLEESEREHILEALHFTGWQVSGARGAALLLGLKPTTLEARMKRLGIRRPLPPSARVAYAG
jgi:transcriptional regulator with GAF, ATPase, and Fis domain